MLTAVFVLNEHTPGNKKVTKLYVDETNKQKHSAIKRSDTHNMDKPPKNIMLP